LSYAGVLVCEVYTDITLALNRPCWRNLRPWNVLQYLPRRARQLGDVHRDKERLVAQQPPKSSAFVSVIGAIAAARTSNRRGS
jgi:hypothetical protein